jgi:hypothetical protein
MTKIDRTEILKLVIEFDDDIGDKDVDLGGVHFSCDDREYSLDTSRVTRYDNVLEATLERDDEVFNESKYNLTSEDLLHGVNIQAHVQSDATIQYMHVIARHGDMTIALTSTQEQ